jgi:hypothetical protein
MDPTILSYSKLGQWRLVNNIIAPMILDSTVVEHSVAFPSMFHYNISSIEKLNDKNSTEMVQILIFTKLVGTTAITDILSNIGRIPIFVIVYQYFEQDDTNEETVLNPKSMEIVFKRDSLINKWKELRQKGGDKDMTFLTKADHLYTEITKQMLIGGISTLTYEWQASIKLDIQQMENAGARFLAMRKEAKDENKEGIVKPDTDISTKSKKIKTVMSYSFGGGTEDITLAPQQITTTPTTDDIDNPNPSSDLDVQLSLLTDPLTIFLRYAGGTYGSTVSKLYRHKPTRTYMHYSSWKRVEEYCSATRDWVYTSLRRLQQQATIWSKKIHNRPWYLLAILCHQDSDMFFLSARLCGLMMRESELYQVTRGNRTLNDMTKHLKDVNDTSEMLMKEIKSNPGLCCNFIEYS